MGSDSRAGSDVPSHDDGLGGAATQPGARADVVIVLHQVHGRLAALSVPRDLLVVPRPGVVQRLALTYLTSPQALVNGLCRSVGIAVTRMVVIDMRGLADVVDDLGGITVDVPHPVRDHLAHLDIAHAGRQRIGGLTALALVRSRHPQQYLDGRWVATAEGPGAQSRTTHAGQVLSALAVAARDARDNPITVQRILWTLTGSLVTDKGTGLFDLRALTGIGAAPRDLPAQSLGGGAVLLPDSSTAAALRSVGLGGGCSLR